MRDEMDIGIVGLGLIGGSLALDLKAQHRYRILGVSRRAETCEQAVARGIVDDASPDLGLLASASLVFICTPIGAMRSTVEQLIPHLSPDAILTDVGSVKAPIVDMITPLWENFVGGHPMAGTEESGLDAAIAGLFVNRAYVLTPTETTPPRSVETVSNIARSLKSVVYQCLPQDHDLAVAWISHLPVMVSASLISACMTESHHPVLELAQALASSGFRDTSRVGGGNPELGLMMARYNQAALARSLYAYRERLDYFIDAIERGDWNTLEAELRQTQRDRPKFVE